MLLQSFDKLGQSAFDHSKDKFLVQSCMVEEGFAMEYAKKKAEMESMTSSSVAAADGSSSSDAAGKVGKELAESLTGMWNKASSGSGGVDVPIFNKKLQVKLTVAASSTTAGSVAAVTPKGMGTTSQHKPSLDSMTPEQMFAEITSLRRKYDELVTFSVNLTAERDILNNTLEQTKRDLNREIARSRDNKSGTGGAGGVVGIASEAIDGGKGGGSLLVSLFKLLFVGMLFFLIGVKAKYMNMEVVEMLFDVPVLGDAVRAEL